MHHRCIHHDVVTACCRTHLMDGPMDIEQNGAGGQTANVQVRAMSSAQTKLGGTVRNTDQILAVLQEFIVKAPGAQAPRNVSFCRHVSHP